MLSRATADVVSMTLMMITTILVISNVNNGDENMVISIKESDSRDRDNNVDAFRLIMS